MSETGKYLKILGRKRPVLETASPFEDRAIVHGPHDTHELPDSMADDLLNKTEKCLKNVYEARGRDSQKHADLIDKTLRDGREGLAVIGNEDTAAITNEQAIAIEAVIIANGSRPSIKVDDIIDGAEIEWGEWEQSFINHSDNILKVAESVGRINFNGHHAGTGFVVGPDLILTNHHVLDVFADENEAGEWTFKNGSTEIDFGAHRYNIAKEVLLAGPRKNTNVVDFGDTDMALLRCSGSLENFPEPLFLKRSDALMFPQRRFYVLGYPGQPRPGHEDFETLFTLFNFEFGVKRFSPGEIDHTPGFHGDDIRNSVFAHDCTTLGGNSGSAVIELDRHGNGVYGLHFSGAKRVGNYAHSLASLRFDLENHGVQFEPAGASV